MRAHRLLYQPGEYYRDFARNSPSFAVALGGFLLIALVESADTLLSFHDAYIEELALGVGLNWLATAFLFGVLWFHAGARMFGGGATLDVTLTAVGYALLWPAIAAVLVIAGAAHLGPGSDSIVLGSIALRALLGLWAIALATIGTKYVHALSWPRAILVCLWFPVLVFGVAAVLDYLAP